MVNTWEQIELMKDLPVSVTEYQRKMLSPEIGTAALTIVSCANITLPTLLGRSFEAPPLIVILRTGSFRVNLIYEYRQQGSYWMWPVPVFDADRGSLNPAGKLTYRVREEVDDHLIDTAGVNLHPLNRVIMKRLVSFIAEFDGHVQRCRLEHSCAFLDRGNGGDRSRIDYRLS